MDPYNQFAHRNLGLAYEQKKMYDQAVAEFQKVQELSKGDFGNFALGHAYALAGKREEALAIIEKIFKNGHAPPLRLAVIYAGLNDKEQAFAWLEKAFQKHSPLLERIKVDPYFDNLRSDPRLFSLLQRMNLPV